MAEDLNQIARSVYQKDLYDDYVVLSIRLDTADLEHGDRIRITAEKSNQVEGKSASEADSDPASDDADDDE